MKRPSDPAAIPPLDARARQAIAAYRDLEPPPDVRARVWTRLEREPAARATSPIPRPVAIVLGLAAAVVLLLWIAIIVDEDIARPRARDAAMGASDQAEPEPAEDSHVRASTRRADHDPRPSSDVEPASAVEPQPSLMSSGIERVTRAPTRRAPKVEPTAPAQAPEAAPGRQLALEQAVLERGWSALQDARARDAQRAAEEHARRFPRGILEPEREALRAAARCHLTPVDRPAQLSAFTRAHPRSPLLGRVRAACTRR